MLAYSFLLSPGLVYSQGPWSPTRATVLPGLEALLPRGEKTFYRLAADRPDRPAAAAGLAAIGAAVADTFTIPILLVAALPAWGGSLLPGVLAALVAVWCCLCMHRVQTPPNPFLAMMSRGDFHDLMGAGDVETFWLQTGLLVSVVLAFGQCRESGALSDTAFVIAVAAHSAANVAIRVSLGLWAGGRSRGEDALLVAVERRLLELSLACAAAIWWLGRDDVPAVPTAEGSEVAAAGAPGAGDGLAAKLLSFVGLSSELDLRASDILVALYLCVTTAIATRATLAGVRWGTSYIEELSGVRRPAGGAYVLCKDAAAARAALDRATPVGVVLSAVDLWGNLDPG